MSPVPHPLAASTGATFPSHPFPLAHSAQLLGPNLKFRFELLEGANAPRIVQIHAKLLYASADLHGKGFANGYGADSMHG